MKQTLTKNELENLKRSMIYCIRSGHRGKYYQYKVLYAAFGSLERKLNLQEPSLGKLLRTTANIQHQSILRLLFENNMKPREIVNLRINGELVFQSNRGKKYSVRTIQKIRENALKKVRNNT